ncbi:unnamed protein product [Soboliphyme baturini]|uniref:Eukaryotic translation initiation factor 3 subunit K n=1 Tax=Soboliphyme baturini TaxID=241478 RepID=A0A183IQX7_9BILA|nr:unnamed protein product [Soboliphyme baturini]
MLEECVNAQIAEEKYDLDANLNLLKLYQLNPTMYKADVVAKILIKCVMALPKSDLVLAKCLIDQSRTDDRLVKLILEFGNLLEVCQFRSVWKLLRDNPDTFGEIRGFEDSIRDFICHVINITYQNIDYNLLKELLGKIDDEQVTTYINKNNWEVKSDSVVFITNHMATIRSRNIEEKIDPSGILETLRAAA